jgi:hypothetical protein
MLDAVAAHQHELSVVIHIGAFQHLDTAVAVSLGLGPAALAAAEESELEVEYGEDGRHDHHNTDNCSHTPHADATLNPVFPRAASGGTKRTINGT